MWRRNLSSDLVTMKNEEILLCYGVRVGREITSKINKIAISQAQNFDSGAHEVTTL